jgi:hypothetical protein
MSNRHIMEKTMKELKKKTYTKPEIMKVELIAEEAVLGNICNVSGIPDTGIPCNLQAG